MAVRIHLNEVLSEMKSGKAFDVKFCTCDERRKRGGEIQELKGVTVQGTDYQNSIRRILLPSQKIREIHIRLIMFFNGKKVFY